MVLAHTTVPERGVQTKGRLNILARPTASYVGRQYRHEAEQRIWIESSWAERMRCKTHQTQTSAKTLSKRDTV